MGQADDFPNVAVPGQAFSVGYCFKNLGLHGLSVRGNGGVKEGWAGTRLDFQFQTAKVTKEPETQ